jgi:hypothetical protein
MMDLVLNIFAIVAFGFWATVGAVKLYRTFRKEPPLEPGECQCGHLRCAHANGTGRCAITPAPFIQCGCQHFIMESNKTVVEDELTQLRKIAGLK